MNIRKKVTRTLSLPQYVWDAIGQMAGESDISRSVFLLNLIRNAHPEELKRAFNQAKATHNYQGDYDHEDKKISVGQ